MTIARRELREHAELVGAGSARSRRASARGRSSCGTWPQSSSRCSARRAAPRARGAAKAIGTSRSCAPHTNSAGGSSSGRRVQKPVVAVGLLEVDVARRRVERGAAARRRGRRAGTRRRRRRSSRPARRGRRGARPPRRSARGAGWTRPSCGRHEAQERRPRALAQPGQRRREQPEPPDALGMASPTSSATRPPMLLPTSVRRGRCSSASSSATTARGEERRVVGGARAAWPSRRSRAGRAAITRWSVGERGDASAGRRPSSRRARAAARPAARARPGSSRARRVVGLDAAGSAGAPVRRRRRAVAARKPTPRCRSWRTLSRPARKASIPPRRSSARRSHVARVGAQQRVGVAPSAPAQRARRRREDGVPRAAPCALEADARRAAAEVEDLGVVAPGQGARAGGGPEVAMANGDPLSGDANAGRDARRRCTACGGSACALTASWRGIVTVKLLTGRPRSLTGRRSARPRTVVTRRVPRYTRADRSRREPNRSPTFSRRLGAQRFSARPSRRGARREQAVLERAAASRVARAVGVRDLQDAVGLRGKKGAVVPRGDEVPARPAGDDVGLRRSGRLQVDLRDDPVGAIDDEEGRRVAGDRRAAEGDAVRVAHGRQGRAPAASHVDDADRPALAVRMMGGVQLAAGAEGPGRRR